MRRAAQAALATLAVLALLCVAAAAFGAPADDPRYCVVAPVRASDGKIARSKSVLREFRRLHPCPATGKSTGACPGWSLDHVVPLACGGCDAVSNLQWLPNDMKSASGAIPKDRWERKVYCR